MFPQRENIFSSSFFGKDWLPSWIKFIENTCLIQSLTDYSTIWNTQAIYQFFNHFKKAWMVWWTWSRLGCVVLGPWLNLAESSAVKWRECPLLGWEELIKIIKVRFSTQCLALVSQSMFTSSPTSPPFRNSDINYYHQRDWPESMYCGFVETVSIKLSVFAQLSEWHVPQEGLCSFL